MPFQFQSNLKHWMIHVTKWQCRSILHGNVFNWLITSITLSKSSVRQKSIIHRMYGLNFNFSHIKVEVQEKQNINTVRTLVWIRHVSKALFSLFLGFLASNHITGMVNNEKMKFLCHTHRYTRWVKSSSQRRPSINLENSIWNIIVNA